MRIRWRAVSGVAVGALAISLGACGAPGATTSTRERSYPSDQTERTEPQPTLGDSTGTTLPAAPPQHDSLPVPNPGYEPPGLVPVARADYLQAPRDFEGGLKRLTVPASDGIDAVPKEAALAPVDGAGNEIPLSFGDRAPEVRLALFTAVTGYAERLVWAVIADNVPIFDLGGGMTWPPTPPTVAREVRGTAVTIVDALTGRALVGWTGGST